MHCSLWYVHTVVSGKDRHNVGYDPVSQHRASLAQSLQALHRPRQEIQTQNFWQALYAVQALKSVSQTKSSQVELQDGKTFWMNIQYTVETQICGACKWDRKPYNVGEKIFHSFWQIWILTDELQTCRIDPDSLKLALTSVVQR